MNKKTLKALKSSIKKWNKNANITDLAKAKLGSTDCPLCTLYFENGCIGCPIFVSTDNYRCRNTPYVDANDAYYERDLCSFQNAAFQEVDFLTSLLPPD